MHPAKDAFEYWGQEYKRTVDITPEDEKRLWTPPCHTDDILYVRETWGHGYYDGTYIYKADDKLAELPTFKESSKMIYKPSIHMPKEAARIFLKVTNVRVERLQDIDDDGVVSEGLEIGAPFDELWNSTIKKSDLGRYGWDANPFVWVIEFERIVPDGN